MTTPIIVGKKTTSEGIECEIIIEFGRAIYPYPYHYYTISLHPTSKGMKHPNYIKTKRNLRDDWTTDITNTWFLPNSVTPSQFDKLMVLTSQFSEDEIRPRY